MSIEIASNISQDNKKMPIYLDYQSTTPTDKRVVDAMLPCLPSTLAPAFA